MLSSPTVIFDCYCSTRIFSDASYREDLLRERYYAYMVFLQGSS